MFQTLRHDRTTSIAHLSGGGHIWALGALPERIELYGSMVFTCGRRASSAALSTPFRTSNRSILKSP